MHDNDLCLTENKEFFIKERPNKMLVDFSFRKGVTLGGHFSDSLGGWEKG